MLGGELDNVPAAVNYFQYDCCHHNSMVKITKGCDVVYHCAATAYEGLSVFSPHVVTQNIVTASVFALQRSDRESREEDRLLFVDGALWGQRGAVPRKLRAAATRPLRHRQGRGEQMLRNLCETHGVEYVIAVPHNIIGPRQKYDDPYRNVASIMMNLMMQGRQPTIYGDGEQKRCFSFVDDDIYCLKEMAYRPDVVGELINIGPDEEFVTINELANNIANLLKFNVNPIYMPGRPQEVKLATCSADKARKLLGYQTKVKMEDGLQAMIDHIRRKGPRPFRYHLDLEIVSELTPRTWKEKLF